MDRRSSIKNIVLGSVATGLAAQGCKVEKEETEIPLVEGKGDSWRTPSENEHIETINTETYFNPHERNTLIALCDLILPPGPEYKGASDVGVVDFIEFTAKDQEKVGQKLRGGLMWLDHESNIKNNVPFTSASETQQKVILDEIAYYDPNILEKERPYGVNFFSLVRNLTLTGFYTSKEGIEELGYKGNSPNVWDGVPEDVLQQHGVAYDSEWIAKCVDQSQRNTIAEWDEDGNLLT